MIVSCRACGRSIEQGKGLVLPSLSQRRAIENAQTGKDARLSAMENESRIRVLMKENTKFIETDHRSERIVRRFWSSEGRGSLRASGPSAWTYHVLVQISSLSDAEGGLRGVVGTAARTQSSQWQVGTRVVAVVPSTRSNFVVVHEEQITEIPEIADEPSSASVALLLIQAAVLDTGKSAASVARVLEHLGVKAILIPLSLPLILPRLSPGDVIMGRLPTESARTIPRNNAVSVFNWNDADQGALATVAQNPWLISTTMEAHLPKALAAVSVENVSLTPAQLLPPTFDVSKSLTLADDKNVLAISPSLPELALRNFSGPKNRLLHGAVDYLQSLPIDLRLEACDTTSVDALTTLIKSLDCPLAGCVLTAAVLADSFFLKQDAETFPIPFKPKTDAYFALEKVVAVEILDFLLAISSVVSFDAAGQTNYASANTGIEYLKARYPNAWAFRNPLIIFHGGAGDIAAFRAIQEQFSTPLWAIQPTREAPLDTVDTLAQFYFEKIKEARPAGPYRIAGFSASSMTMLRLAQLLEANEDEIVQLTFVDHHPMVFTSPLHGFTADVQTFEDLILYGRKASVAMVADCCSCDFAPARRTCGDSLVAASEGRPSAAKSWEWIKKTTEMNLKQVVEFGGGWSTWAAPETKTREEAARRRMVEEIAKVRTPINAPIANWGLRQRGTRTQYFDLGHFDIFEKADFSRCLEFDWVDPQPSHELASMVHNPAMKDLGVMFKILDTVALRVTADTLKQNPPVGSEISRQRLFDVTEEFVRTQSQSTWTDEEYQRSKTLFPLYFETTDRISRVHPSIMESPARSEPWLQLGHYDIITGLNVIHAVPDLNATLHDLNTLLAPGGRLLVVNTDGTARSANPPRPGAIWNDFIWGSFHGLFGYTDDRAHCTIDEKEWRIRLAVTGYSNIKETVNLLKRRISQLEAQEKKAHSKTNVASQVKSFANLGRAICKVVSTFDSVERLIAEDDRRHDLEHARTHWGQVTLGDEVHEKEEVPTMEQDILHNGYRELCRFIVPLRKLLAEADHEELAPVLSALRGGSRNTRSDDTENMREAIVPWLVAAIPDLNPALDPDSRENRGIYNDDLGRLLCPVKFDWNDQSVQTAIREGDPNYLITAGVGGPAYILLANLIQLTPSQMFSS
ncbi:hypothetical protein K438DRAFT_1974293 [Mycena galopus ATCC 62051]|nr:hypothetical protein K438DRAFT_1974293 [Mycena galopus ATCC 62051]